MYFWLATGQLPSQDSTRRSSHQKMAEATKVTIYINTLKVPNLLKSILRKTQDALSSFSQKQDRDDEGKIGKP